MLSVFPADPLLGALTYLHATARDHVAARVHTALGLAGLIFWPFIINSDAFPVAGAKWAYVATILAFPLVATPLGLLWLRRIREHKSTSV